MLVVKRGLPMSTKALWLIGGLCVVLHVFIMIFPFDFPAQEDQMLVSLFSIMYHTGVWIIGAELVFSCLWGKGRPGLVLGVLMLLFYTVITFITMFGLMPLTNEWELLWYIHPLLVFPGCIFAIWSGKKKRTDTRVVRR